MTDEEGLLIELALHLGFQMTNDDGDEYACTEAQLLEFAKRLLGRAKLDDREQMATVYVQNGGST